VLVQLTGRAAQYPNLDTAVAQSLSDMTSDFFKGNGAIAFCGFVQSSSNSQVPPINSNSDAKDIAAEIHHNQTAENKPR